MPPVGELGELLELLHRAGTDDRTVRATIRSWSDWRRAAEAFREAAEEEGGTVFTAYAVISDEDEEEDARAREPELTRLWRAPPDRVRLEAAGGPEPRIAVRAGPRWWSYDEQNGAMSNEDDEEVHSSVGEEYRALFEPGRLLGALALEPAGTGQVAGRPARLALARPRRGRDADASWVLHEIGAGADEWRLAVDCEHGVLLSVEARRGGEPFRRVEVLELAIGEPIPDEVFTFEPPTGEEVRGVGEDFRVHHHVRLDELGRLAPFAVFVPDRLSPGWRLESSFAEGSERPRVPPTVHVQVVSADGHWQVAMDQVAAAEADPDERFDALDHPDAWETVKRDGRTIAVREPAESWARSIARVDIEGTRITLSSDTMGAEQLVELAARLVRAPEAPPPL